MGAGRVEGGQGEEGRGPLHPAPGASYFLVFHVFLGGWGPYYDRLGRSGAREKDT